MDDFVIHRGAKHGGKSVVPLERGDGAQRVHLRRSRIFQIHRRGAGQYKWTDGLMHLPQHLPGAAHLFDLCGGF